MNKDPQATKRRVLILDTDADHVRNLQTLTDAWSSATWVTELNQLLDLYKSAHSEIEHLFIDLACIHQDPVGVVQQLSALSDTQPHVIFMAKQTSQYIIDITLQAGNTHLLIKPLRKEIWKPLLDRIAAHSLSETQQYTEHFLNHFLVAFTLQKRQALREQYPNYTLSEPRGVESILDVYHLLLDDLELDQLPDVDPEILIVEDEEPLSHVLQGFLKNWGYPHLDCVQNGKDALQAITSKTYDLVLLDIGLPDLSGLHVLKAIREQFPRNLGYFSDPQIGPEVIALTCYQDESTVAQMIEGGCGDYISKPYKPIVLKEKLKQRLLHRHALLIIPTLLEHLEQKCKKRRF